MSLFLSFIKTHRLRLTVVSLLIIILLFLYFFINSKYPEKSSVYQDIPESSSSPSSAPDNNTPDKINNIGYNEPDNFDNINYNNGKKNLPIFSVSLSSDTKKVAFSFDASWGDENTGKILDILDKYNIKTTFFVTGTWVDSFPDAVFEVYSRGHDIGNHSKSHKHMSKLSSSEQIEELKYVNEKVKELTGYEPFLFRAPYGDFNDLLIDTVYSQKMYPIQWNVDSLDWKDYGTESIIRNVSQSKRLCNGSIILFHNAAKFTPAALESIINTLLNNGYTIVPVSELIYRNNYHLDNNGVQIKNEVATFPDATTS